MEHKVAEILTEQELHGWHFNERKAYELESTLRTELESLSRSLRERFPHVPTKEFTPSRNNKTRGYVKDCTFTRITELNVTSRDHIAWVMGWHFKWKAVEFTASGKPTIDEVVLKDIGTPIALEFLRCLDISKALGMLSEGVNAWLRLVREERIHHHCSVATNTYRCAHRKPNLGQVKSDKEFRELFEATPGQTMVGADLSGIELRMLAHYLARFDGGRYAEILLHGDIHQVNADKIGVTRRQVKTISYAFLYGAGVTKIGRTYDPQLTEKEARKKGREIYEAYMDAIPGLKKLVTAVKSKAESGYINLCDGRRCYVDGSHKALNYLLQGSSGVLARRWLLMAYENSKQLSRAPLAFVHDELQYECDPAHADELAKILESSAAEAGEFYNLRLPIAAEAKIGMNWSEVH